MASNRLIASVSALTLAAVVAGGMAIADQPISADNAPAGECLAPDWRADTDNPYLERVQDFLEAYDDPTLTVNSTDINPGAYLLGVLENARTADGEEFRICIGEAETEEADYLADKLESNSAFSPQSYRQYERGELVGTLIHDASVKIGNFIHEHLYEDPSGPFEIDAEAGVLTISPEFFDLENVTDKTSDAFLRAGMGLTYELQGLDFATRDIGQYDLAVPPNFYAVNIAPALHGSQSVAADMFSMAVSGDDIGDFNSYFYSRGTGEFIDAIQPSSGAPLHIIPEALENIGPHEAGLLGRCHSGQYDTRASFGDYASVLGLDQSFVPGLVRGRGANIDSDRNLQRALAMRDPSYLSSLQSHVAQVNAGLSDEVKEEARGLLVDILENLGTQNDINQINSLPLDNVVPALVQVYAVNLAGGHIQRVTDSNFRYLAGNACEVFEGDYPGQPTLAQ